MKKSMITIFFVWLFIIFSGGTIFGFTPVKKAYARQKIAVLKRQIKAEQEAYQLALSADLSEDEKAQLTEKYTQDRRNLFQQVRKQRDSIAGRMMSPMQKMLWDTAKFAGVAALIGLAVYNFFSTPPAKVEIAPEVPLSVSVDKNASDQKSLEQDEPKQLPSLTKKEVERYRNISHTSGKVGSTLTFLSMGIPALLPFAIAADLSAIYYGIKTLDLKPINVYPIVFNEIMIMPEDMPY